MKQKSLLSLMQTKFEVVVRQLYEQTRIVRAGGQLVSIF